MKKPLQILFVEDNPDDVDLLLGELRRAGFDPKWTRVETEEAYLKALETGPDIILSDYAMPEFSGLLALELLNRSGLDIPFIIISGTIGEDMAVEVMKKGASDYLIKDRLARLGQAVAHALEENRMRAERKRARAEIHFQKLLLEAQSEASIDGILTVDANGDIISFNRRFVEMWGISEEVLAARSDGPVLKSVVDCIVDSEQFLDRVNYLYEHRDLTSLEEILLKDRRVFDRYTSPVKGADGAYYGRIWTFRDITERKRAEEELRTTHAQLRELLDHTPAVIYRLQIDGEKIIPRTVSENITTLLGFTAQEALSYEWWLEHLHPQDRQEAIAGISETLTRNVSQGEYRLRHKDGSYRWVQENRRLIRDASGKPAEFVGLWTDITERKRAEEVLRGVASEEADWRKRKPAMELGLIAILSVLVFIIGDYTDMFLPMFRYFAETDKGQVDTHADELGGALMFFCVAMLVFSYRRWREGKAEVVSQSHVSKALRKLHDEMDTQVRQRTAELDKRNKELQTEITERKRAMEQIQEQAALLDKAQDAIMVCDLEGRIFFWNKAAERIYGWTRKEAWAMPVSSLFSNDTAGETEANKAVLKEGEWSGELQITAKDGRKLTVEARRTLMRDGQGNPKSILSINTDITERKKIEAQFLRAQRMESIGTLASGIAHDLNNILAPIMMSVEMLKTKSSDPLTDSMLETLESCAQRGSDIVRQVLSFGRGLEGHSVEVLPKHLLKDIEGIIKDTFPKDIRLRFSAVHDGWTIRGDPTQLHQVLLNLCVNARDAMPHGGQLTINVENSTLDGHDAAMNRQVKAGDYVVITVTDTGSGIPQEIIGKIFDPFFTTKEIGKGTGLGLSTVQGIVKSHDGFLNVYSEPGKGTTFRLYFPAITGSQAGREQDIRATLPRGNGETVLMIDDEASILTITSQTLEAFGYRILTANNGAAAVAAYAQRQNEIAVVITDMMMPVMDGRATIHALKQINPAVKVIAASGLTANADAAIAAGVGVKHFLSKPYTAEALLKMLHAVLEGE